MISNGFLCLHYEFDGDTKPFVLDGFGSGTGAGGISSALLFDLPLSFDLNLAVSPLLFFFSSLSASTLFIRESKRKILERNMKVRSKPALLSPEDDEDGL